MSRQCHVPAAFILSGKKNLVEPFCFKYFFFAFVVHSRTSSGTYNVMCYFFIISYVCLGDGRVENVSAFGFEFTTCYAVQLTVEVDMYRKMQLMFTHTEFVASPSSYEAQVNLLIGDDMCSHY